MKFREHYNLPCEKSKELDKILNEEIGSIWGVGATGGGAAGAAGAGLLGGGALAKAATIAGSALLGPLGIGAALGVALGPSVIRRINKWKNSKPVTLTNADISNIKGVQITKSLYDYLLSIVTADFASYKSIEAKSPTIFKTLRTSALRKNYWVYTNQPVNRELDNSTAEALEKQFKLSKDHLWRIYDSSVYRTTNGGKIYLFIILDNLEPSSKTESVISSWMKLVTELENTVDDEKVSDDVDVNKMKKDIGAANSDHPNAMKNIEVPQMELTKHAKFYMSMDANAEKWLFDKVHMNLRQVLSKYTNISKDLLQREIDKMQKELNSSIETVATSSKTDKSEPNNQSKTNKSEQTDKNIKSVENNKSEDIIESEYKQFFKPEMFEKLLYTSKNVELKLKDSLKIKNTKTFKVNKDSKDYDITIFKTDTDKLGFILNSTFNLSPVTVTNEETNDYLNMDIRNELKNEEIKSVLIDNLTNKLEGGVDKVVADTLSNAEVEDIVKNKGKIEDNKIHKEIYIELKNLGFETDEQIDEFIGKAFEDNGDSYNAIKNEYETNPSNYSNVIEALKDEDVLNTILYYYTKIDSLFNKINDFNAALTKIREVGMFKDGKWVFTIGEILFLIQKLEIDKQGSTDNNSEPVAEELPTL